MAAAVAFSFNLSMGVRFAARLLCWFTTSWDLAARPGLWQVVSTTQHTHNADIKKPQPRYNHHVQMHLICFHSSSPARVLFGIRSLLLLFLFLSQFFHCQLIPWCIRLRRIVFRQCLENRPTEQWRLWQPLPTVKGPHWRLMGTYVNSSFGKPQ